MNKDKCQFKHHKYINNINNKIMFKIKNLEKIPLIIMIEISKGPGRDKILKIETGMQGIIINSICKICMPCTIVR